MGQLASLPRMRGDDPQHPLMHASLDGFAPHARG